MPARRDYTVAWICALPLELCAVMLDEVHDKLPVQNKHESTYILGRIDVHSIVISCLPKMGMTAAARSAALLSSGFGSLKFILMVGVGGGVPTIHDIRLGDVVVSMPGKTHKGVVHYGFGTKLQGEPLKIREGRTNEPPDVLLTAVAALHAEDNRSGATKRLGERLADYVTALSARTSELGRIKRPNTDNLFASTYRHKDDSKLCKDCHCDLSQVVQDRPERAHGNIPHIHQGLIASADHVMRDAIERDRLARELDMLCFDMEAAGLTQDLGCLVIRGISDYSDSHKSKEWQGYAAAVAAAYARELLKVVPRLCEDGQEEATSAAGPNHTFNQAHASGGHFNNFAGPFNISGGNSSFGSTHYHK